MQKLSCGLACLACFVVPANAHAQAPHLETDFVKTWMDASPKKRVYYGRVEVDNSGLFYKTFNMKPPTKKEHVPTIRVEGELRFTKRPTTTTRFAVWLSDTTDALLKEVADFPSVSHVILSDLKGISDNGLEHLSKLKDLEYLSLHIPDLGAADAKNLITDAGMKHLGKLTKLRGLRLCYPDMTAAGLKELATLNELRALNIEGTIRFTDEGLKYIGGLKRLAQLYLQSKAITDQGLAELGGLKELKVLVIGGTQITDKGIQTLRKLLPGCKVIRS